jgi:lipid II:glycine glycyltransferase (peptidoglycan interpeptide bridge formation enzyme)
MLSLKRKVGPIVFKHNHNYDKINYFDALKFTFYYRINTIQKHFGFIQKYYYTVNNFLDKSIDEIFNGFSSTVKNEIRRSEKVNVQIGFINDVDKFIQFYNSFANEKDIFEIDEALIFGYRDNLLITCATYNNEILSAHAYLIDKQAGITRLLYSASIRLVEDVDSTFISRANKYLHFKDMEYFKAEGLLIYDFGGYAYNTHEIQKLGINKFKLSFGGEIVKYYDYQSYLTVLSAWVMKLVKKKVKG